MSNKLIFILSFAFLFFISCSPDPCYNKGQFIDSYKAFFNEFENEEGELSDKQIEVYEARYTDLLENCYKKYKPDLSPEERKNFWKSSISFYIEKEGGIFKIKFNDQNEDDPIKKYIVEEIEEIADSTSQDFAEIVESVLEDELPKLIDSFVGKVQEIGDEIKAGLKED